MVELDSFNCKKRCLPDKDLSGLDPGLLGEQNGRKGLFFIGPHY